MKKIIFLTLSLCLIYSQTFGFMLMRSGGVVDSACSGSGTFGTSSGGAGTGTALSRLNQWTAGSDICASIGGIQTTTTFTSSDHVRIVVYADNSDAPGTLIAISNEITGDATANTQEVSFPTPFQLSIGVKYWVGYISDQNFTYNFTGIQSPLNYYLITYSGYPTPPDPYNGTSTSTKEIVVYVRSN